MSAEKPIAAYAVWAAVSTARKPQQRQRYIHIDTIRSTRREARAAYLDVWPDKTSEGQAQVLRYVTFERVVVGPEEPEHG